MFLSDEQFSEIGHILRGKAGTARRREMRAAVTLGDAVGSRIDASIRHLARGSVGLICDRPWDVGDRFGIEILDDSKRHFLFCEVQACSFKNREFSVGASILAHGM